MSWQELTGSRVRVNDIAARVVHVDSFRVVLVTEPQEDVPAHRLVVSPDDGVDIELLDERDKH
jgi:hypothetical protein